MTNKKFMLLSIALLVCGCGQRDSASLLNPTPDADPPLVVDADQPSLDANHPPMIDAGVASADAVHTADATPDAPLTTPDAPAIPDATAPDAAPDANTQIDPENCGITGRSCLGATCSAGICSASEVDPGGVTQIGDFTADDLFVYYTGFQGPATQFNSLSHLWRTAIGVDGATPESCATLAIGYEVSALEFDFSNDEFYIVENTIDGPHEISEYGAVPYSQATLVSNLITQSATLAYTAIFVYSNEVYWATSANGGEIDKMNIASLQKTTIATNAGVVTYMKTDGANIYWTGNGYLKKAPMTGGPPVTLGNVLMDASNGLTQLAIDGSNVYATDADNAVLAFSLATGEQFSNGWSASIGIAADDSYIYAGAYDEIIAYRSNQRDYAGSYLNVWASEMHPLSNGCYSKDTVNRINVVGDYLYFSTVQIDQCSGARGSEAIFRVPKL